MAATSTSPSPEAAHPTGTQFGAVLPLPAVSNNPQGRSRGSPYAERFRAVASAWPDLLRNASVTFVDQVQNWIEGRAGATDGEPEKLTGLKVNEGKGLLTYNEGTPISYIGNTRGRNVAFTSNGRYFDSLWKDVLAAEAQAGVTGTRSILAKSMDLEPVSALGRGDSFTPESPRQEWESGSPPVYQLGGKVCTPEGGDSEETCILDWDDAKEALRVDKERGVFSLMFNGLEVEDCFRKLGWLDLEDSGAYINQFLILEVISSAGGLNLRSAALVVKVAVWGARHYCDQDDKYSWAISKDQDDEYIKANKYSECPMRSWLTREEDVTLMVDRFSGFKNTMVGEWVGNRRSNLDTTLAPSKSGAAPAWGTDQILSTLWITEGDGLNDSREWALSVYKDVLTVFGDDTSIDDWRSLFLWITRNGEGELPGGQTAAKFVKLLRTAVSSMDKFVGAPQDLHLAFSAAVTVLVRSQTAYVARGRNLGTLDVVEACLRRPHLATAVTLLALAAGTPATASNVIIDKDVPACPRVEILLPLMRSHGGHSMAVNAITLMRREHDAGGLASISGGVAYTRALGKCLTILSVAAALCALYVWLCITRGADGTFGAYTSLPLLLAGAVLGVGPALYRRGWQYYDFLRLRMPVQYTSDLGSDAYDLLSGPARKGLVRVGGQFRFIYNVAEPPDATVFADRPGRLIHLARCEQPASIIARDGENDFIVATPEISTLVKDFDKMVQLVVNDAAWLPVSFSIASSNNNWEPLKYWCGTMGGPRNERGQYNIN